MPPSSRGGEELGSQRHGVVTCSEGFELANPALLRMSSRSEPSSLKAASLTAGLVQRNEDTDVPEVLIGHNADGARSEARVGSKMPGFVEYQLAKGLMVFTHTEVDPAYEGQGVGSALARAALDDVRGTNLEGPSVCPFIKGWIGGHREYVDLVYGVPPSTVIDWPQSPGDLAMIEARAMQGRGRMRTARGLEPGLAGQRSQHRRPGPAPRT